MQANTALAFFLCGLGLLAALRRYHNLNLICGLIVGLLGLFTLIEYQSGFDLGIDRLLVAQPFVTVKTSHPGRMSPLTAFCMPGMDDFDLCSKLRALPANTTTPVIFVTVLNGFEARVRSAQGGGDDFIAKPFLYLELAVKALYQILRGQLKFAPPSFHSVSLKSG